MVTDSAGLLRRERTLIATVKQPQLYAPRTAADSARAATLHLTIGFIELRLGDIAGPRHYDGAASEFQWASELRAAWPFPWFGLGLAELGAGDSHSAVVHDLQTMLGRDALTRSAIDFARSAQVDSGFVDGLVELSRIALRQRAHARLDVALAALRRAAATPAARDPAVLLARCRIERAVGSPDSALAAVQAVLALQPDNPAALLEMARTRFMLDDVGGGAPWYRGLLLADSTTLTRYRGDLRPVFPDSTLRAFDAASPAERVALVRHFFTSRDRRELHLPGERLLEHYRRLDYAERNYRLVASSRQYDIVERYRSGQTEFDDRGIVYIREGRPDARRRLDVNALPPNETWVYHRGTGDLLFNFVALHGPEDYRLVESLLDVLGNGNAIRLAGTGDVQGNDLAPLPGAGSQGGSPGPEAADSLARVRQDANLSAIAAQLIRSRIGLNPVYQRMLTAGHASAAGLEATERQIGRHSITVGTTTDSWPLSFDSVMTAQLQIAAVGVDSAGPEVQLAFAIPRGGMPSNAMDASGRYPLGIRAAFLALGGEVVTSVDTEVAARLVETPDSGLVGRFPVVVPPGTFAARVALNVGSSGVVWSVDTVEVASPMGPGVGVSDLALGSRRVPLFWTTAQGDTVWIDPRDSFSIAEPLQLYFDVTGLAPDRRYRTQLDIHQVEGGWGVWRAIKHLFGGGPPHIGMTFEQTAHRPVDPVQRELNLSRLKPGDYVLTVKVSGPTGVTVTRRRTIAITP
jgi:GWxTD domain-containing protein